MSNNENRVGNPSRPSLALVFDELARIRSLMDRLDDTPRLVDVCFTIGEKRQIVDLKDANRGKLESDPALRDDVVAAFKRALARRAAELVTAVYT